MNKGFTLKSVLIVLGVVVLMILIAFFAQRKEKEISFLEKEIENEIVSEEMTEFNNDNLGNEVIQEDNDNDNVPENNNNQQVIVFPEIQIIEADCGEANYLTLRVKQDLALRTSTSLQEIKTISCQEDFFSDHTLGTSGPGEVFPQTLTFGYIMTFLLNGQEYKYHINDNTILFVN